MSRVYEALKKAERLRAIAPAPAAWTGETADSDEAGLAAKKPEAGSAPSAGAQELPLPEPDAGLSKSDHGPRLVVGCREYAAAAEQFHVFGRRLHDWAVNHDKRTFAITSALSGEGKSFIALNLAVSLARSGNRVILVDADLRAPSLHRFFNLAAMSGLVDYLEGDADFNRCLHPTAIERLWLVPAGGTSREPAEALGGERMREFMREARAMVPASYVIIDTSAASAVPEAQLVARQSDALVIVVAANRTPREMVRRTIENATGTTIFGIALNRFEPPRSTVVHYPDKYTWPPRL